MFDRLTLLPILRAFETCSVQRTDQLQTSESQESTQLNCMKLLNKCCAIVNSDSVR